MTKHDGHV